jgi:hypothetical protein
VVDDEAQDARDCIAKCGHFRARTDARYVATMHPGVGLALADWLDDDAEMCESLTLANLGPDEAALRIADLILGGTNG